MAQWVKVAKEGDLSEGQVKVVEAGGERVGLARLNGQYFAIEDRCSHDDGPLGEGQIVEGLIECPRHGARFDLTTGRPVTLPAVVPVKVFPVKVAGHEIFVEI